MHAVAAGAAFPNAAILTVKDSGNSSATAFAIFGMAKMGLATFIAFLATHFVDAPAEYFLGSIVVCSGLAFVIALGYNARSLAYGDSASNSPIKTEPKS